MSLHASEPKSRTNVLPDPTRPRALWPRTGHLFLPGGGRPGPVKTRCGQDVSAMPGEALGTRSDACGCPPPRGIDHVQLGPEAAHPHGPQNQSSGKRKRSPDHAWPCAHCLAHCSSWRAGQGQAWTQPPRGPARLSAAETESRLPCPRGRPKPAALVIMNTERDPGPNRHEDPGSSLPGWLCELIASSGFSFKRFKMAQNFHVNESSKEPRVRAAHTSPATGRAGPQPPKHPGLTDHVAGPEIQRRAGISRGS